MLRDHNLPPLSQQHHNALALPIDPHRTGAHNSTATNGELLAPKVGGRYDIDIELVIHFVQVPS